MGVSFFETLGDAESEVVDEIEGILVREVTSPLLEDTPRLTVIGITKRKGEP